MDRSLQLIGFSNPIASPSSSGLIDCNELLLEKYLSPITSIRGL